MTTPDERRVFISYRRDDCAAHAGWLADTLRRHHAGQVFLDVDTIALGENFVKRIEREIERCDVVLVLIGREWLTLVDSDGSPRIFDELDWVHLEIKAALERDVPVIPVLVEGARMPRPQQLPESVRDLAFRNGFELSPTRWEADVLRLVGQLPPMSTPAGPSHPGAVAARVSTTSEPHTAPARAPFGVPGRELLNREGTDVVVVAAGLAYPDYRLTSGYVCQPNRAFRRGTTRIGFYGSKQIYPEFPLILHRRDRVLFTSENAAELRRRAADFDAEVAALIETPFDAAAGLRCQRILGDTYQVFCLTGPTDERTLRVDVPIEHHAASAWTQNQRYVHTRLLQSRPSITTGPGGLAPDRARPMLSGLPRLPSLRAAAGVLPAYMSGMRA